MYAYIIPYLNAVILYILFTASSIYSYVELISILSRYCCFMCDLYLWVCLYVFLCLNIFCNKASGEFSVTERFTLYKYIWNKK